MSMKKLNNYDREIIDRLLSTKKPYSRRVANIFIDKDIPLVQGYRTLTEAVIELENIKESLEKELRDYKMKDTYIQPMIVPNGAKFMS